MLNSGFNSASEQVETTPRKDASLSLDYSPSIARYPFTAGWTERVFRPEKFTPLPGFEPQTLSTAGRSVNHYAMGPYGLK